MCNFRLALLDDRFPHTSHVNGFLTFTSSKSVKLIIFLFFFSIILHYKTQLLLTLSNQHDKDVVKFSWNRYAPKPVFFKKYTLRQFFGVECASGTVAQNDPIKLKFCGTP